MDESIVYDLFDSLNKLTKGMLKKKYGLKKIYCKKWDIDNCTTSKLCFYEKKKGEPDGIIISGKPEEVYSCLTAFFRGVNLGISYALKAFFTKAKVRSDIVAHLLHID